MTAAITPADRCKEPVEDACFQRQVEGLAIERRQPGDHAVGNHIGAEPHGPDRQCALQVDALEELAPV